MRLLIIVFAALLLAGCATTGGTTSVSVAERPLGDVIRMTPNDFFALGLLPTTYGEYSCRKPRGAGQLNYCVRPRDLYAATLECRYERDGKWNLRGIFPFHEAYICRSRAYAFDRGVRTHSYTWELSF